MSRARRRELGKGEAYKYVPRRFRSDRPGALRPAQKETVPQALLQHISSPRPQGRSSSLRLAQAIGLCTANSTRGASDPSASTQVGFGEQKDILKDTSERSAWSSPVSRRPRRTTNRNLSRLQGAHPKHVPMVLIPSPPFAIVPSSVRHGCLVRGGTSSTPYLPQRWRISRRTVFEWPSPPLAFAAIVVLVLHLGRTSATPNQTAVCVLQRVPQATDAMMYSAVVRVSWIVCAPRGKQIQRRQIFFSSRRPALIFTGRFFCPKINPPPCTINI